MNLNRFYKGKKILITGGLGFLGSNLAHRLVQCGAQVTLLDCLLEMHGGNPFNIREISKKVRWVKGDIRNRPLLEKLIRGQNVLFNIAAQTSHTDSMEHPLLDAAINNVGQINILESCRKINPSVRVLYCSTRAIYGNTIKKLTGEETPSNPLDIYSANKLAGEHYHRIYSSVRGLNATIVRLANCYGPRAQMEQPSFGILNWFIRLALDDRKIKIFGDGRQVRDYVYVDDTVDAFLSIAASPKLSGEILNVGCGRGIPLIEMVKNIVRIAGSGKIVYVPWPEQNKKIDVGHFVADVGKIRRMTGWQAHTSLHEGLKKTIDFYRKYKAHYWR